MPTPPRTIEIWRFLSIFPILAIVPAASFAGSLETNASQSPASSGWEAASCEDLSQGPLQNRSLLEASLIASGVQDSQQLRGYELRFVQLNSGLADLTLAESTAPQRAAAVLDYLHDKILTGEYRPGCTELDRTLDSGDYNCVTATILYRLLAAECELPLLTLAQPGHVFCQLADPQPVVIQTTSPQGLVSPQASRSAPAATAFDADPTELRQLSEVQLVAKIFYNRGLALLQGEDFEKALPLLRMATELDPQDDVARRNVLACLNNWALAECRNSRFERALSLLDQGRQLDPQYSPFAENERYVYGCWVRQLRSQGRYTRAVQVLQAARQRQDTAAVFPPVQSLVLEALSPSLLVPVPAAQSGGVGRSADR